MGLTRSKFGSKLTCNPSPCFSPSTATSNTLIKTLKRLRNDSNWGERALGEIEKKRLKIGMEMCLSLKTKFPTLTEDLAIRGDVSTEACECTILGCSSSDDYAEGKIKKRKAAYVYSQMEEVNGGNLTLGDSKAQVC